MSIAAFGEWLYATPISTLIRDTVWVIPTVQSIHILAIAVVVGSALVTEMRLGGLLATDRPAAEVLGRFLPWLGGALLVLLGTGLILIVAEPGRTLGNTIFWIKMALVAGASLVTLRARKSLLVPAAANGANGEMVEASRPLAWMMLLIWCAVIFCGRFIAYT